MSSVYEFIDGEEANYTILSMCIWAGVSRSGYYDWLDRPLSATAERRAWLKVRIAAVFDEAEGRYGYRRVRVTLLRAGVDVSEALVRLLMRELGLVACQPRPFRPTTTVTDDLARTADLVARDFTADRPGVKLVGDITYIPTWQGWVYLATVIDCYSKAVVGWSMAAHMKASLVCDAMTMAAGNIKLQPDCVFHSDRGTQYTSSEYRNLLTRLQVAPSVGRTGVCWDNALAESFFAALKNELVNRTVYATRKNARSDIARYIEGFYNRTRLHSGLGYRTPLEVRNKYANHQVAA